MFIGFRFTVSRFGVQGLGENSAQAQTGMAVL